MYPVIAIDGPAASGKSTVAKQLALKLNFIYVNTGAMYRTLAWKMLQDKIDVTKPEVVAAHLKKIKFECSIENGETRLRIDGVDPIPHLRDAHINDQVSQVAAIPEVRILLVKHQRELSNQAPLVMEGRDIGTVVFPETPHKFFLDADPEIRHQRRLKQGEQDMITKRDNLDRSRVSSPLKCADDAIKVDTSYDTVAQNVTTIVQHLESQGLAIV
jgi:cytidylate kinase